MANGFKSGSDREAMLRRVAIVLSSLPAPVASQLLGSVDPETKRAVSRTITSLSDVDPLERRRALHAFKMSVEQQPRTSRPEPTVQTVGVDRFESSAASQPDSGGTPPSVARVVSSASVSPLPETSEQESPLSFLDRVDEETLVRLLCFEHPQAVALVLASIAPAHAARILPRLDSRVQNDALSRIGRLGEIPQAAVAEIADHFRSRVAQHEDSQRSATGQRALDAILAALPAAAAVNRDAATEPSPESPAPSFRSPAETPHAAPVPDPDVKPASVAALSFPSAEVPALDLTHKLRLAEQTWPEDPADPQSPQEPPSGSDNPGASFDSTDAIHQHLIALSPAELCQALGRVGARDMVLALCGMPNEVTDAALSTLPRAQAKKVRANMATLGSLHLREIDEAKEKVARASLVNATHDVPLAA